MQEIGARPPSRFGSADFQALVCARIFFIFASQMQAVIIGWQVYAMTHQPIALGLVGLAEAVPALGFALYAGWVVDRSEPRRIYLGVLFLCFASTLIILVTTPDYVPAFGSWHLHALYLSSVLTGLARAFSQPALYAIVPRLVARESLAKASAWMTSSQQMARVLGPALGGIVYGYFGMGVAGLVCACCFAVSLGVMRLMRPIPPIAPAPGQPKKQCDELLGGLRFVFGHPILLSALSLDMFSVLFGGISAVLPIYAQEILAIGPRGLGALRAAPAIGAVVGGILLTRYDIRPRAGSFLLMAVLGYGICILGFALSHTLWISLFALACSGTFDSVSVNIRSVVVQLASPEHMRGRISAVNSMFIGSSNEIGEFESGVMASLLGTQPSVVVGALLCMSVVGVVAYFAPRLRSLDVRAM